MKTLILIAAMFIACAGIAQTGKSKSSSGSSSSTKSSSTSSQKQYKSAETGRYVTKTQAEKSPSTTYSTKRKSK